jgi:glutathione S-transferase
MPQLIGLPYSPWSEKARWALESRGVKYESRRYEPIIGEPGLRLKLNKWTGKVTVPVLIDDAGKAYGDSADIARWADTQGEGPVLFPKGHENDVVRFVELSERALAAGRALALERMLEDDAALLEMVPRGMRKFPAIGRRVGKLGITRTLKKYGSRGDLDARRDAFRAELNELRRAREGAGNRNTLLDAFSFADIAASQALTFVDPPKSGLKIGDASRRSFRDETLAAEFADLLAWRDELYRAHR